MLCICIDAFLSKSLEFINFLFMLYYQPAQECYSFLSLMLYSQRSDLDKITDLALNKVRRFFFFLQFKNSSISIRLLIDEYWQCNIAKKAVGHHGRNWNLRKEVVWMYPSWFLRRSKWMYETMVDWSRMGVPLGLPDMWMNYKFSSLFS